MNKFKIGDRISAYSGHYKQTGTVTRVDVNGDIIDFEEDKTLEPMIGWHYKQCRKLVKKKRECPQCFKFKARIHNLLDELAKEVQKNHAPVRSTDWCTNCLTSNTKLNLMQLKLDELQRTHITREKLAEAYSKVFGSGYLNAPNFKSLCKELGL